MKGDFEFGTFAEDEVTYLGFGISKAQNEVPDGMRLNPNGYWGGINDIAISRGSIIQRDDHLSEVGNLLRDLNRRN